MTRQRTSRPARLAALTATLPLMLAFTACGGDDGSEAPENASKDDFCEAYQADPESADDLDPDASPEEQAKVVKDTLQELSDQLEETGTPEDIPDDAREGYEITINAVNDLDEDEIQEAIEKKDDEFFDNIVTGDDKEKADAFEDWASDYCGDSSDSGDSGSDDGQ